MSARKKLPPCPTEHEEQVRFAAWFGAVAVHRWHGLQLPDGRPALIAIPNGGERHPAVAAKLRAEGVSAGVPDLLIPLPRGHSHGLWIEMKKQRGGRVSPKQAAWHEYHEQVGYCVVVAPGCDAAIEAVEEYMEGTP